MKKLVITGYSSRIAVELIKRVEGEERNLDIIRCGRRDDADLAVDFGDLMSVGTFIERLEELRPDYLFVNHGMMSGKRIRDLGVDAIAESVNTNLISYLMIVEAISRFEGLRSVVMSSVSGKRGSYDTLYAGCKGGVDVAIRYYARLVPASSRLNAVAPSIVGDAKMTLVRRDLDVLRRRVEEIPTKQFTSAKDVAGLVYYLLFESENINGQSINIDGGWYFS